MLESWGNLNVEDIRIGDTTHCGKIHHYCGGILAIAAESVAHFEVVNSVRSAYDIESIDGLIYPAISGCRPKQDFCKYVSAINKDQESVTEGTLAILRMMDEDL